MHPKGTLITLIMVIMILINFCKNQKQRNPIFDYNFKEQTISLEQRDQRNTMFDYNFKEQTISLDQRDHNLF